MSKRKAKQRRMCRALEWRRMTRRIPLRMRRWRWFIEVGAPAFAALLSPFAAALGAAERSSDGEQA